MSEILKRQRIAVEAEGDKVCLKLGNVDVRMSYETAIVLSQWLRMKGKEAKRTAGDVSRHWSAIGTLHNATPDQYGKTFNIRK